MTRSAKDLKIISKNGAGVDSVDMASATVLGIAVMITNNILYYLRGEI